MANTVLVVPLSMLTDYHVGQRVFFTSNAPKLRPHWSLPRAKNSSREGVDLERAYRWRSQLPCLGWGGTGFDLFAGFACSAGNLLAGHGWRPRWLAANPCGSRQKSGA